MARRKEAHGGGHGWFVTFADLMGLLVSFFVMLVAFSNQDSKKLQIVAGSMRDAFGVQTNVRYSGVVEVDGLSTRPKLKNAAHIDPRMRRRRRRPTSRITSASMAPGTKTTRPSRWLRRRSAKRSRTCRS
jgi:chemotaxis protein MotB